MDSVAPASVAIKKVASRAKVWVELTSGAIGCVVRSGKDDLSWAVVQYSKGWPTGLADWQAPSAEE